MIVVYDYMLSVDATIDLPVGAEVLGVSSQENDIVLWAKVESLAARTEKRRFLTVRTGQEISAGLEPMRFIGTSIYGKRAYHTFELV